MFDEEDEDEIQLTKAGIGLFLKGQLERIYVDKVQATVKIKKEQGFEVITFELYDLNLKVTVSDNVELN